MGRAGEINNGLIAAAWGALYKLTSVSLNSLRKHCKIGPEKPQGECPITCNYNYNLGPFRVPVIAKTNMTENNSLNQKWYLGVINISSQELSQNLPRKSPSFLLSPDRLPDQLTSSYLPLGITDCFHQENVVSCAMSHVRIFALGHYLFPKIDSFYSRDFYRLLKIKWCKITGPPCYCYDVLHFKL